MTFNDPKIGIIGLGFVGEAIFRNTAGLTRIAIDTDITKGYTGTYKELEDTEGIFVCVPSPQLPDGSCDTSILEQVLDNLKNYKGVIISKVTAPPDVYIRLGNKYPNLVHIPEFLTAANAEIDYANEKWAIIGGTVLAYQREAERILKYNKDGLISWFCPIGEAAMVKYITNSFLATKVVFMNEMEEVASKNNFNWNRIRTMISQDPRINLSHTQVPGPDGHYGFGGMCFPKDTSAFIRYSETIGVSLNVLKEAVKKNTLLRLQKPK